MNKDEKDAMLPLLEWAQADIENHIVFAVAYDRSKNDGNMTKLAYGTKADLISALTYIAVNNSDYEDIFREVATAIPEIKRRLGIAKDDTATPGDNAAS